MTCRNRGSLTLKYAFEMKCSHLERPDIIHREPFAMQRSAENQEWWCDTRQFSTGGNYINFLTGDEGSERIQATLGKRIQRLA